MTPVAVITGASAGIGAELARVFARNGHALVLVARRRDRLEMLADEIAASGAPRPFVIALDLSEPGAASRIRQALDDNGLEAQYIVNNAGFGLTGRVTAIERTEMLGMVDVNVRALTDLSLVFLDSLIRQRGGVLNVGSVAGFVPGPSSAIYYASKAFVVSFSEALHYELRAKGVRVSVLCPGPVATEFQARAGIPEMKIPSVLDVPAARVAEIGYRGLMRGRRVVIAGLGNKILVALLRILPNSLLLGLVERRQRGRRT